MINKEKLANRIKSLREFSSLSQEELAQKIGLSRVAVSQIEQAKRGVDFLELAKIAQVFKLKTDFFLMNDELPEVKQIKNIHTINKFCPEKLKNVILYILERCAGKPNVGETVLYKLLYFVDFNNFEINNKPVSGLSYIHLQYGPVPVANQFLPVIEKMKADDELKIIIQNYFGLKLKRYINLTTYDTDILSSAEIKVIDDVITSLSNMSASEIEEYSHGDAPWCLSDDKEIMPYNLVFERQVPYSKKRNNDFKLFNETSAKDILNELGPISISEYNYYENL